MNALPQAMAVANIQLGTMAGKLNGVMPASTPSGWRMVVTSTPRLTCSLNPPFSRLGTPQANSTFSRPRATSPAASDSTLPCSRGDDRGEVVAAGVEQLAHPEQHLGPGAERHRPPLGERLAGDGDGLVDLLGRRQLHLAGDGAGGGVVDGRRATGRPGPVLAPDEVADGLRGTLGPAISASP